jgi:hypothetical protein
VVDACGSDAEYHMRHRGDPVTRGVEPRKYGDEAVQVHPMTMAAVKRASLKKIDGSASVKAAHKAISTSVATTPAATPLHTAAPQFTRRHRGALAARTDSGGRLRFPLNDG